MAPTALIAAPPVASPSTRSSMASARARVTTSRRMLAEPPRKVLTDPEGVGHDGQGRIDGGAGGKERRVDDVQVVDLVRAAVRVQRGRCRIVAESHRSVLVSDAGERDPLSQVDVAGK